MKIIFTFFIVLTVVSSCESKYRKAADEIVANAPEPVNMNVGTEKYNLFIPEGWTTEHRQVYGIEYYYLLAPKTPYDPNTNINVATEFMQHLTLEEYLAGTIQSLKKSIPTAVISGQGEIVAHDLKGVWYSYSMTPQGIKASLVSYIFPKNGIAYIITAGTQTSDAAKYRKTFDRVAKSFKFRQD